MFTPINGYTKKSMIETIEREFKGKSVSDRKSCLYRGPEGKKCAVGMFIPDSKYSPQMEGCSIQYMHERSFWHKIKSAMPLETQAMQEFQAVHDSIRMDVFDSERTDEEVLMDLVTWIEANVAEDVTSG